MVKIPIRPFMTVVDIHLLNYTKIPLIALILMFLAMINQISFKIPYYFADMIKGPYIDNKWIFNP